MLGIIGFFIKRTLHKLEDKQEHLDNCIDEVKEEVKKYVSRESFDTTRTEFRDNFKALFVDQAAHGQILAKLEERSRGEDRLVAVMETIRMTLVSIDTNRRRK